MTEKRFEKVVERTEKSKKESFWFLFNLILFALSLISLEIYKISPFRSTKFSVFIGFIIGYTLVLVLWSLVDYQRTLKIYWREIK